MKHHRWAGAFCVLTGVSMTGMWAFFLLNDLVPELTTVPVEAAFSIAADNGTALLLAAAGYGLLREKIWAQRLFTVSMGALFYSLMIAIGYYAQLGEYVFLGMFAIIFVLMLYFTYTTMKDYGASSPAS